MYDRFRLAWRPEQGGFGAPPNITAAIASTPAPVHPDTMAKLGAAMVRAAQSSEPELICAEIGKMALNAELFYSLALAHVQ